MGNILRFALQMELDGKNFYHKQALLIQEPYAKRVFLNLADDEEKHYEQIKSLLDTATFRYLDSEQLKAIQNIFTSNSFVVEPDMHVFDILNIALRFEQLSVKFYHELAEISEGDAKNAFLLLKEEEQKHKQQVWQLMQLLQRPEEWYPYLD